MLPRMDGLRVVETLRQERNSTPVLFLSALSDVDDRIKGLRAGGDDYLTKPYAFAELLARLDALVRRRDPGSVKTKVAGGALQPGPVFPTPPPNRPAGGNEAARIPPAAYLICAT